MAETTAGSFIVSKDLSANQLQGAFVCSCGTKSPGTAIVQKGSTRSFNCTRCKKRVTVFVPK